MGCQQFAIDLQTLMGHLQASSLAYLLKALQLWLEILGGHSVWRENVVSENGRLFLVVGIFQGVNENFFQIGQEHVVGLSVDGLLTVGTTKKLHGAVDGLEQGNNRVGFFHVCQPCGRNGRSTEMGSENHARDHTPGC